MSYVNDGMRLFDRAFESVKRTRYEFDGFGKSLVMVMISVLAYTVAI